jgi:hypothetical protein
MVLDGVADKASLKAAAQGYTTRYSSNCAPYTIYLLYLSVLGIAALWRVLSLKVSQTSDDFHPNKKQNLPGKALRYDAKYHFNT